MTPLDGRLADAERTVPNLRPACAKRLLWAAEPGRKTPLAVVYVHGFSASLEEIRPVPDRIAAALGANLFFTRLTGHGQDGAALGAVQLEDWRRDIAEAAGIGQQIGDRILWIACSTGASLVTWALAQGLPGDAAILVSPYFRLARPWTERIVGLPGARTWLPRITGPEREFQVLNPDHADFWTPRYPVRAVFPLTAAGRAARRAALGRLRQPALFVYAPDDRVVSAHAVRDAARRWGGPAETLEIACGPQDDPMRHIIAGRIFSAGQTDGVVAASVAWARRHGL